MAAKQQIFSFNIVHWGISDVGLQFSIGKKIDVKKLKSQIPKKYVINDSEDFIRFYTRNSGVIFNVGIFGNGTVWMFTNPKSEKIINKHATYTRSFISHFTI